MKLDNVEVKVGKHVFDVVWGGGVIKSLPPGDAQMEVLFGSGKRFYYDSNGVGQFGRKTLYLRSPFGKVLPNDDEETWALYTKICDHAAEALGLI